MTSPTLLAELPEIIASKIKAVMPELAQCKGMAGRFDVEQLKSLGVSSPAVLVSRLRTVQDKTYAGPHVTYQVELAAFIICKDRLGVGRHELAGRIAQVLLALVPNNDWARPDDVAPAEGVQELPVSTKAADDLGMAIIAVTWRQQLALSGYPEGEVIRPEVYLGQAPLIGQANTEAYQEIGGTDGI